MYCLLRVIIRNDEYDKYTKEFYINIFNNEDDAYNFFVEKIYEDEQNNNLNLVKDNVMKYLKKKGIWNWEWRRKGNGDYYKLFETDNISEINFFYNHHIAEDSKDIDNI